MDKIVASGQGPLHPSHESYFILSTQLNIYIYPSELIEKNFEKRNWVICNSLKKTKDAYLEQGQQSLKDIHL